MTSEQKPTGASPIVKRGRPDDLPSDTTRIVTGCGPAFITITTLDNKPFEIFLHGRQREICRTAQLEALCRTLTTSLRCGVPAAMLHQQLSGIRCGTTTWDNGIEVKSCADAIAIVLKAHLPPEPETTPRDTDKTAKEVPNAR